jgi:ribosomal protein L3 glutamine methyltransferase
VLKEQGEFNLNTFSQKFSENPKREKVYTTFLSLCDQNKASLGDIIQMGYRLMRKARLHHHFFKDYALLSTAEYLAYHALGKIQDNKQPNHDYRLTVEEASCIITLFEKRIAERMPIAYITNEADYCGRSFFVNQDVLVPRSIMSTRFHDFLRGIHWENHRVLDLCTGSGCIGITLALLNPEIKVDLLDISPKALAVANINIEKHGLTDRVKCIQSNLFENVQEKYDLIITNPPYVSRKEYNASPAEFKNEPKIALESGEDGLDILHTILAQAKNHLNNQGVLIAEVGFTAAKRLKKKYPSVPFNWFAYRRPDGKEPLFAMDCIFLCKKEDFSQSSHAKETFSWMKKIFWRRSLPVE